MKRRDTAEMQKKLKKRLKPWHLGTHLRVLSESYPMNTNMTWFSKTFHPCALGESSLSIGRVIIGNTGKTHILPVAMFTNQACGRDS